jgi:hypothetical protein
MIMVPFPPIDLGILGSAFNSNDRNSITQLHLHVVSSGPLVPLGDAVPWHHAECTSDGPSGYDSRPGAADAVILP